MKTVQIDDDTEKMLSEYCQYMNVSETEAVHKGIRWLYKQMKKNPGWHKAGGWQKLKDGQKAEIILLLQTGEKQADVARRFNISRQYANYLYKKFIKN